MRKIPILTIVIMACFVMMDLSSAAVGIRIVSLAPSTTEILFALGLDKEIVGVSSWCNYPLEAGKRPKVGTMSDPNIEQILILKPDLILCTGLEQAPMIRKLEQIGLKVIVSNPSSIEELCLSIRSIGRLVGKGDAADRIVGSIESELAKIEMKIPSRKGPDRPKVLLEVWHNPLLTVGGKSFISDVITKAGGVNIASDIQRPYLHVNTEWVLAKDPDCVIIGYMAYFNNALAVGKRVGWGDVAAVRNKRIYNDINPDILFRPGPRTIEAVKLIHERIYSEK